MILILCVDDCLGMSFMGRRQSRDRVLCADIASLTEGRPLYADSRSRPLFEDSALSILSPADFPKGPGEGDFCFLEFIAPGSFEEDIEKLVLYRWNRRYPADLHFDIDLGRWRLVSARDFAGSSHEKITKEVYVRE